MIRSSQVTVISGETGCGKTTQVIKHGSYNNQWKIWKVGKVKEKKYILGVQFTKGENTF